MTESPQPMGESIVFGDREIGYDESVLAPRPWTAAQSYWARELLFEAGPGGVLELCAGAGHIGLLAVEGSDRALVQVDADVQACSWARRNAQAWGVSSDIRHGPMSEVLTPGERFVLVIADPPWVPSDRIHEFPRDPVGAIDGGRDGLQLARECLDVIARHLTRDGVALLQVRDEVQGRDLTADAVGRGLTIGEIRQFERGAVLLVRRSAEGPGTEPEPADLTVDPRHDRVSEPGGENEVRRVPR